MLHNCDLMGNICGVHHSNDPCYSHAVSIIARYQHIQPLFPVIPGSMNMKINIMKFCATILVALFPCITLAHHSRANFDDTRDITLTGTIIDYSWRNPHVYLEVQADDEAGTSQTWLVEAHSVTGMRGQGWNADTLAPGSEVTISGQPDRRADKHFVLLNYVEKSDGERLYAFGRGRGSKTASARPAIEPSTDFSGTWSMDMRGFDIRSAGGGPSKDWPYTDKARAMAAEFSVEDNPELECLQIGVPKMTLYPYGINWFRDEDRIRIEKEHLDEKRLIWLDANVEQLKDAPSSFVGTSTGHFESANHLVVETRGFLPTRWGNANGIDSSEQKKVLEHYALSDDGLSMELSYTIEDPEYLTEPVTVTGRFLKGPNREFTEFGCDRKSASRHLSVE
jgi:hypothetical protein